MRVRRILAVVAVLAMLASTTVSAAVAATDTAQPAGASNDCIHFPETGQSLCGGFLAYWQELGGLELFGFPLTSEFVENGVVTQYFERARFEWHPGVWPERFDVLLGRIGIEHAVDRQQEIAFHPVDSTPAGCVFHPETGHNLCGGFLAFWQQFGGLAVFGHPISEEFEELNADTGETYTVQYFERHRFEWHPGEAPARFDVMLGRLGAELLPAQPDPGEPGPGEPGPGVEVVALALGNPRGMVVGPDGALYVALAGSGGDGPCRPAVEGDGEECYGATGSIVRIMDGNVETVASGLPSLANEGAGAVGVHDVTFLGDDLYAVIGWGGEPAAREDLGDVGNQFGWLVKIEADGSVTQIADITAFEEEANPHEAMVDSNPFSLVAHNDVLYVTDAGGNSLLQVSLDGTVQLVTAFPDIMAEAPPFLGLPPGTKIPAEPVPTYVRVGADGALYVAELTGFPFEVGSAKVWRVVPGEEPTVFAEGFTNIMGLAPAPDGSMYVAEMASNGLLSGDVTGALYRVSSDGTKTLLVGEGLMAPTGLALGPDGTIYSANLGVVPASGQVVQITP